ncbi:MAG: glycosyltransferase family 4 protein [Candidatus Omnitrophota bacterium]|jgi:glycosyltransferase involved in cell wall biosynthesis
MNTEQKTNILYVITKLELGGAQKQLLELIRGLDKTRFNIFLFTAQKGILMPDALSMNEINVKRSSWLERNLNPVKDLFSLVELFIFIKRNKIDIIHTHSSKAGILGRIAGRLAGTKTVMHTVHGWPFHRYQPFLARIIFLWLERIAATCSDKLIVVSQSDLHKGLKYICNNQNKYALMNYGVETNLNAEQSYEAVKKELQIKEGDLIVGNISCFKPQKAPLDFLKLAALVKKSHPRVKFVLVGDGILRKKIQSQILHFGLQESVTLTGWRKDIPKLLSNMDILVLTSLWEGMPISVLEAMRCAKPVVATDTGGIREIVVDGYNGFLVKPQDIQSMSEKLSLLLNNKELREKMGCLGQDNLGSKFSLKGMVQANQDLYTSLTETFKIYAN